QLIMVVAPKLCVLSSECLGIYLKTIYLLMILTRRCFQIIYLQKKLAIQIYSSVRVVNKDLVIFYFGKLLTQNFGLQMCYGLTSMKKYLNAHYLIMRRE